MIEIRFPLRRIVTLYNRCAKLEGAMIRDTCPICDSGALVYDGKLFYCQDCEERIVHVPPPDKGGLIVECARCGKSLANRYDSEINHVVVVPCECGEVAVKEGGL